MSRQPLRTILVGHLVEFLDTLSAGGWAGTNDELRALLQDRWRAGTPALQAQWTGPVPRSFPLHSTHSPAAMLVDYRDELESHGWKVHVARGEPVRVRLTRLPELEGAALKHLEPHPIAERYPLLTGDDYEQFKASVKTNGQRVSIVLFEGKILDGRNRYRACRELGIEPKTEVFTGSEAEAAVLADVYNLDRRHLTREQKRAVIAYKIKATPDRSDRSIAAEVKASPSTVAAVRQTVAPSGVQVGHLPKPRAVKGRDGKRYAVKAKPVPATDEASRSRPADELVVVRKGKSPATPLLNDAVAHLDQIFGDVRRVANKSPSDQATETPTLESAIRRVPLVVERLLAAIKAIHGADAGEPSASQRATASGAQNDAVNAIHKIRKDNPLRLSSLAWVMRHICNSI